MTPRARALLLRLVACEINGETYGAMELRKILRLALGLDDATVARAVARIREAIEDGR